MSEVGEGKNALRESTLPTENLEVEIWEPTPVEKEFLKRTVHQDEEEMKRRVVDIHLKAYKAWAYPCIRFFYTVKFTMSRTPIYNRVLEGAISAPPNQVPKLLEVGCCLGTDLRKLHLDGYPSTALDPNLIGLDLRQEFIDIGHTLYQDSPSSSSPAPISFHSGDIFNNTHPTYKTLQQISNLRYIFIGAVFHLFNEETQTLLAMRLVELLNPPKERPLNTPPVQYIIFGTQSGASASPGIIVDYAKYGADRYRHTPNTWRALWKSIFEKKYGSDWVDEHLEVTVLDPEYIVIKDLSYPEMMWSVCINL